MTEIIKTYTVKSGAIRAAKKALETSPEGTEFAIIENDGAFSFSLTFPAAEPVPAHDPIETMKAVDNISGPAEGPVDDVTPKFITDVAPRPGSDLPETQLDLTQRLLALIDAEDEEAIRKIADDVGVPFSELRGMDQETAVAHLVKIIIDDRAAWDVDFGGKKAPKVKTEKAETERTHKSGIEKPCTVVWDVASAMFAADPNTKRKDVLAECERRGVAFYTARTQYQQWLVATRASAKK